MAVQTTTKYVASGIAALTVTAAGIGALVAQDASAATPSAGAHSRQVLTDPAGDVVRYRATGGDGITQPVTLPHRHSPDLRQVTTLHTTKAVVVKARFDRFESAGDRILDAYLADGQGKRRFQVRVRSVDSMAFDQLFQITPDAGPAQPYRHELSCDGISSDFQGMNNVITVRVPNQCLPHPERLTVSGAAYDTEPAGRQDVFLRDGVGDLDVLTVE